MVGAAAIAVARAATAGLLLATLTKDEERVTLQILGDGPLGTLTVDAAAYAVTPSRAQLRTVAGVSGTVPLGRSTAPQRRSTTSQRVPASPCTPSATHNISTKLKQ